LEPDCRPLHRSRRRRRSFSHAAVAEFLSSARRRRRELIGALPQKKFRNFINQLIFVAFIRPYDLLS
jgi:hypothetical protein